MSEEFPSRQPEQAPGGWGALAPPLWPLPLEVFPFDDLEEHERGTGCWCKPRWDQMVLVHNAADGREKAEWS